MPAALHMLLSEEKYTYYILLILENQAGAVGRGWGTKGLRFLQLHYKIYIS
jgi:hypothetical protein